MKTLVISFLVLFAISFTGYSQDTVFVHGHSQWNVGLKAGINFSSAYALPEAFTAKPTVNFAGGLFMEIPLCRSLSLQPEVLFSTRGIKGTGTSPTNPYSFTRTTNHLDVPVLLVIKPARFISLLAGPQFSYLLRHHDSFSAGAPATRDEFNREPVRKTNVAIVIGAEFIVQHLVFSTRLGWDVLPNTNSSTDLTPRYKYVWYQAALGYKLF
ncbi:porin family protein [Chryseolinea lacunae]|uniref:PorT family protein n=1 Tax=Chryseolinea lacunae TaxID=2801331 RepID=A0ABS1KYW3_9BACT|nr:porin family protein [Chryseolinea lacunae]MBL0744574.1 PorT family protein [Chryseolinea lacunae]